MLLETEKSKGGEGRDLGECREFPEDGERSPFHVRGAETQIYPPAQLPKRHEVLPAEGQPLHSQQEPGVGGHRGGRESGFSPASRSRDTHILIWKHPHGAGHFVSPESGPATLPAYWPPLYWPPLWHQGAALPRGRLYAHKRSCVETLASVTLYFRNIRLQTVFNCTARMKYFPWKLNISPPPCGVFSLGFAVLHKYNLFFFLFCYFYVTFFMRWCPLDVFFCCNKNTDACVKCAHESILYETVNWILFLLFLFQIKSTTWSLEWLSMLCEQLVLEQSLQLAFSKEGGHPQDS